MPICPAACVGELGGRGKVVFSVSWKGGVMQQEIAKGDVLQRIAGIAFIVGAVLVGVFSIVLPRAGDPSDLQEVIQAVADNNGGLFEVEFLLLAVGIWALMIGLVGLYRSISTGGAAAWARLGFYGVIVGTALWTATLFASILGFEEPMRSNFVMTWLALSGGLPDMFRTATNCTGDGFTAIAFDHFFDRHFARK